MSIRHYQPGDEAAQVAIFNAVAAGYPKFKPTTLIEVQRRIRVRDFDPTTRFYAESAGQVVGYAMLQENGRVNFPWCFPGHEQWREPLFDAMLAGLRSRQIPKAFAAYRGDWTDINDFFLAHGFAQTREFVNFFINFFDMPTPSTLQTTSITPLEPADVPAVFDIGAGVILSKTPADLERQLFKNPYFSPDALFALRSKLDRRVLAAGLMIIDGHYADPEKIDPLAPCFRLGAFGTEGLTHKRINGVFSFIAKDDRSLSGYGLELMGEAAGRVRDDDVNNGLAAQVPSDAPGLLAFYHKFFRRQGSFPVLERTV